MHNVFVSHAAEGSIIAEQIADGLVSLGYSTWYFERDTVPGRSYILKSSEAIEAASAVRLLISPHSIDSHEVKNAGCALL